MNETSTTPPGRARRRVAGTVGLLAAGALAGGILAGTLSASADTSSSTGAASGSTGTGMVLNLPADSGTTSTSPGAGTGRHDGPVGGATPVRSDEKALSAADAAKVKAAALAAVPGGTVYRVETDAGDGTYEAHMTKSDGTLLTVKLDSSFAVTGVEDGMGKGDPAPTGQAPNDTQGSTSGSSSSSSGV